jgi:hypothetical protein
MVLSTDNSPLKPGGESALHRETQTRSQVSHGVDRGGYGGVGRGAGPGGRPSVQSADSQTQPLRSSDDTEMRDQRTQDLRLPRTGPRHVRR